MNKTLLKSVREYKKQSVMAPLLVVLEVFMEVLIPLEMAKIIDVGNAHASKQATLTYPRIIAQVQIKEPVEPIAL